MTFAICLQVPNHIHFKKPLNIIAEFIPQILFFHSIFGYLVICIIYKWSVDWSTSSTGPPNLLNMLIYMFLSPGTIEEGSQLYAGQGFVQVVLLLTALVCVPWMLCLKPYMLYKEHQRIKGQGYHGLVGQDNGRNSTDEEADDEEEGAGQAVAQDSEDDHVSSTRSKKSLGRDVLTCLAIRHGRYRRSSSDPHDRVLPRLYLQHRLLPSTLGSFARSRSIVRGVIQYDPRGRIRMDRQHRRWCPLPRLYLCHVVHLDPWYLGHNGGSICLLARLATPLGRSQR